MNGENLVQSMLKEETFAHSGIKGQKWGVRRFQNEDGSLTPEGRERYGLKGGLSSMSDDDLRKAVNAKRLQNRYVELQTEKARKRQGDISGFIKEASGLAGQVTSKTAQSIYLSPMKKAVNEDNAYLEKKNKNLEEMRKSSNASSEDKARYTEEINKNKSIIETNNNDYKKVQGMIEDTGKMLGDKGAGKLADPISKGLTKNEMNEARDRAYRNISEMDEKQLKSVVDRMVLEKEYQDLVNPPKPSKLEKGREWIQTVGSILGVVLTVASIAGIVKQFGEVKSDKKAKHSEELTDKYLAHYGVRGMKKGIRRWTNEDGTLTEAGKEHYGLISKGRAQRDLRYANRMNIGRELLTEYHKYKKEEYENKGKEKKVNKENEKLKNLGELSKGGENFVKDLMKLRKDIKFSNKDKIIENYTVVANIGSLFVNDAIRARVVYGEDGRKTTLGNIRLAKQTNVTIPIITPFAIGVAGFTKTKDKKVLRQQEDSDDYLMHYGVKGMKKGDRRWQNEDGSLTAEGYIHYGINRRDPNARVEEAKQKAKADYKIQKTQAKYANKLSSIQNKQMIKEQRALNKEEQRAQKVADKEEMKVRREQIETRRKNIMKAIVGTAAVAGVAALGYHIFHNRSLDKQLMRDMTLKEQEGQLELDKMGITANKEIKLKEIEKAPELEKAKQATDIARIEADRDIQKDIGLTKRTEAAMRQNIETTKSLTGTLINRSEESRESSSEQSTRNSTGSTSIVRDAKKIVERTRTLEYDELGRPMREGKVNKRARPSRAGILWAFDHGKINEERRDELLNKFNESSTRRSERRKEGKKTVTTILDKVGSVRIPMINASGEITETEFMRMPNKKK